MKEKSILILGGTGAMGSFLTKQLSMSYQIYVTSRKKREQQKNIIYLQGNAHNTNFLKTILHQNKWYAIIDFMHYNTNEFRKRHELILSNTQHYIFLSSSRVYAEYDNFLTEKSKRLLDVSSDKAFLKTDDYALAKARQEDILKKSKYENWTIIRPYMTYDAYRLDLGFFPKELWLYRILHHRSILFPKDISSKMTTLTYGNDVAYVISKLIENPKSKKEIFQITQPKYHSWKEVLELYKNECERKGFSVNIKYIESNPIKKQYIYKYDRLFDRKFDCNKVKEVVGDVNYLDIYEGLRQCINEFLTKPQFKSINWKQQAYWDKQLKERTPIKEINGIKEKIEYLIFRYIISYSTIKNVLNK